MSYQNISNGKPPWSQITMQSAKYFTATVESPFTMTKIQNIKDKLRFVALKPGLSGNCISTFLMSLCKYFANCFASSVFPINK